MARPFISLTSDFGVQTQGVGTMEGVARAIAPEAHVVHLMHGLPSFDITAAARTMEATAYLPCGAHVCVCDPGVGSTRKAIIIETKRGDFLVGPDNGVLIPASRILGGIARVHEIANEKYMRLPVSPLFHGRDVFAPAAAHLACGAAIRDFGPELDEKNLAPPPYEEAVARQGKIVCRVIQINKFGSIHLNIGHSAWDFLGLRLGEYVTLTSARFEPIRLPFARVFADVPEREALIMKDDFGRVEVSVNLGSFVERYPFAIGDDVEIVVG